jgi:tetratricopeptide (TPR) repeat protein
LLAEICVRTVPERQRQQLHDMAARVLELRSPSQVDAISAHYHASGNDESAFSYARRFAERAVSRYAHDSAFAALQVAQRYAPTSNALADLRLRHAHMAIDAGRYDAAETQCDLAMEWLDRTSGDPRTRSARRLREWLAFRRGKPTTRSLNALLREVDGAGGGTEHDASAAALCAADISLTRADWSDAAALANRAVSSVELQASADLASRAWIIESIAAHGNADEQALRLAQEALERRRAARDAWGSARAQLALGDLMLRDGINHAKVDNTLVQALEQARDTHNGSVAAAASRSLGELRARQGRLEEALQWLGDAERLFAAIADEPEFVRTQLVGAMAARDGGDREQAHARFESVAASARSLDIVWIELVANAGAAMCNGGPASDSARTRWARVNDLVADRAPDWWFPGRETVDAFAIHMALNEGHPSLAADLFEQASHRLATRDAFGSAWLVASCAPELERAGFSDAASAREAALEQARSRGFAPLLPQLSIQDRSRGE